MKNKGIYIAIAIFSCVMAWQMGEYAGERKRVVGSAKKVILDTPSAYKKGLIKLHSSEIKNVRYTMTKVVLKDSNAWKKTKTLQIP